MKSKGGSNEQITGPLVMISSITLRADDADY
jgi:hypothetical protein